MTDTLPSFTTGWCNQQEGHPPALHAMCHHTYAHQEKTYVCSCSCHNGQVPQGLQRQPEAAEAPSGASEKHLVKRRPKSRRQVRRV